MLRNHQKSEQLLKYIFSITQQQQRFIQQQQVLCNKSSNNVFRQGKIMGKLFGHRVSGSKKRWFPLATADSTHVLFKHSSFGKAPSRGDKNSTRRMTVLNKLFMKHITDLMATGEISENILGKGLQISRVKISQDFAYVNVFWISSGTVDRDSMLESELQRCSGLLRHELSQLGLMGVVPRIKFVKDKLYDNMYQVENLLSNMDFGTYDQETQVDADLHKADVLKQDFYGNGRNVLKQQEHSNDESSLLNNGQYFSTDIGIPEMRHDVLGLDHKGIMLKILTKMRKSKQAWDQHLQNSTLQSENEDFAESNSTIRSTSFNELAKVNEKLAKVAANSERFEAFLAERKQRRNTPERKKFQATDHPLLHDVNMADEHGLIEKVMSARQRQLSEAEDYLYDDLENKNLK